MNLGGDVRVAGAGPGGGAWTVAVEHPERDEPLVLLGLRGGAVATSTTLRRRWRVGGIDRHHLIDPWTGAPSDTDLVLASAIAGEGWRAEVMAKACLLRGADRAFDLIDATAEVLAVDRDGSLQATEGLHAYLGGRPIPTRPDGGAS